MTLWRATIAVLTLAALVTALFAGPEMLRFGLFWLFFSALPGPAALRLLMVSHPWPYMLAGALTAVTGLGGADFPVAPCFGSLWVPALTGAVLGLGWKYLLNMKRQTATAGTRTKPVPLPLQRGHKALAADGMKMRR